MGKESERIEVEGGEEEIENISLLSKDERERERKVNIKVQVVMIFNN